MSASTKQPSVSEYIECCQSLHVDSAADLHLDETLLTLPSCLQATMTMEAKGESILDKAHQTTGAGLEVGGAHWFAQEGADDDKEAADTSHVDGKIKLQVSIPQSTSAHCWLSMSSMHLHVCRCLLLHPVVCIFTCPGHRLQQSEIEVQTHSSYTRIQILLFNQVLYKISQDGALLMSCSVDTRTFMPLLTAGHINSFPRIGVRLTLPQALHKSLWHGKYEV